ncbi:TPA: protein rep, partial [Proteus mirabilis]
KKKPLILKVRRSKNKGFFYMLYNDNKALIDKVKPARALRLADNAKNGKRLNERKSASLKLAKIYYEWSKKEQNETLARMLKKRAGRVYGCCNNRDVCVDEENYCVNINSFRCRDRNCEECARVRAFVYQQKIRSIIPTLIEQTDKTDGFIFGTLTIKNPHITQLKITLKIMNRAFTRLIARKKLKSVIRGGFRCVEVTRGNIEDHCHPHIHFLIQIARSYFNTKGAFFMSESEWAEEWTRCLEKECECAGVEFNRSDYPSGRAFIKILRIQTPDSLKNAGKIDEKTGKKIKKVYTTIFDLKDGGDNVVNYVLKYSTKSDSVIKNDSWFREFDKQIKGIRAISFFGIYKTLVGEIEEFEYEEEKVIERLKDRINEDMGEKFENLKFYTAQWCDDHQYVLSEQTMQEALNKKRLNIVNSIKGTLKVQIENQNICLNLILNSLKNKDYLITNDAIIELNKIKARTRKTFNRLEKAGEVKNLKDVYNYEFNAELINNFDPLFTESEIEQMIQQNKKSFEILDATIDCPF